jgi:uncharacterized delta-60 repeat protein
MHVPAMLLLLPILFFAAACSSPGSSTSCVSRADCFRGEECVNSQCVVVEADVNVGSQDVHSPDAVGDDEPLPLPRYDEGFGQAGRVGYGLVERHFTATTFLLQRDGKSVIVGSSGTLNLERGFALLRLETDGSIDTSFGNQGYALTPIDAELFAVRAAALDAQGRILALGEGRVHPSPSNIRFFLARYRTDGFLDESFGDAGVLMLDWDTANGVRAAGLLVDSNGKLLIGGEHLSADRARLEFSFARLTADGALDTDFGVDGLFRIPFGDRGARMHTMRLDDQGGIIAIGHALPQQGATRESVIITRTLASGRPDPGFGEGGKVIIDLDTRSAHATSVTPLPSGDLIVGGTRYRDDPFIRAPSSLLLMRLSSKGALVEEFGEAGVVIRNISTGADVVREIFFDRNAGKLLVVADSYEEFRSAVVLAQYNLDGTPDESFGTEGLAHFPSDDDITVRAAVLYDSKRLLLAGDLFPTSWHRVFAARYWIW